MHYNFYQRCIMAGTLSHIKFMQDLDKRINVENKSLFLISGQGHDLLFFVKLRDLKKFEYRSEIAKVIARNKFNTLVKLWQEEVIKKKNEELEILLYGYIAHHVLDSYIHPWINNDCGFYFDKKNRNTWSSNGKHEMLESILDVLVVNPYKIDIPKVILSKDTINSLNILFKQIYDLDNVGFLMFEGIKNVKGFINLYRKDRLKIKRLGYKIIDLFSKKNWTKYTFLSYNYSNKEKNSVREKYLDKFNELYNEALLESCEMIKEIRKNIANKKIANIAFDKSAI